VVVGGELPAGKGINLPSSRLDDIPALTAKDREDLRFGVQQRVDYVSRAATSAWRSPSSACPWCRRR
jgi:pyruvate kinase